MKDISEKHPAGIAWDQFADILLRITPEAVYGVDAAGCCLFANHRCLEMLGYRDEEALLGRNMHVLLHCNEKGEPISPEAHCPMCRPHPGEGHAIADSRFLRRGDGTVLPVRFRTYPLSGRQNPAGAIAAFSDLAEEEDLHRQHGLIIDTTPDSFWIIDQKGYFIDTNEATCRLLGYGIDEIRGMHIADIDVDEKPGDVEQRINHILKHGAATFVRRHRRKDGSILDAEISARAFRGPAGEQRLFGFVRDITGRLAIERELREHRDNLEKLVDARTLALKESEERYRNLTENISDWIWEMDAECRYSYSNPQVRDILGYGPEEVTGFQLFDFLADEGEIRRVKKIFSEAAADGKQLTGLENFARHKDGRPVILETSGIPAYDAAGRFRGYRGINRDVTGKKKMERTIRTIIAGSAKAAGQDFFDSLADTLCSWLNCEISYILDIHGPRAETIIIKADGCHLEPFSFVLQGTPCEEVIRRGYLHLPENVAVRFPHNSNLYTLEASGFVGMPLANRAGEIVGVMAAVSRNPLRLPEEAEIVLPILADRASVELERIRAGRELLQRKIFFESIFNSVPDGVVITNTDQEFIHCNPGLTGMVGYTPGELNGKNINFLLADENDCRQIAHEFLQNDDLRRKRKPVMTEIRYRGGGTVQVEILCTQVRDPEERLHGHMLMIRDITERRRAERELVKYARVQNVLLKEVNHRVKNNLFAIIAMINSQKSQLRGKDEGILCGLEQRVLALAAVHDLLSKSEWQPVYFRELCEKILQRIVESARAEAGLTCTISRSSLLLTSRQAHLAAVLINELGTNVVKYGIGAAPNPAITVDIRQQAAEVTVVFRDNGPGFSPEIFSENAEKRSSQGIGLEIITDAVRRGLQGEINMYNEKGAVVEFSFVAESPGRGEE